MENYLTTTSLRKGARKKSFINRPWRPKLKNCNHVSKYLCFTTMYMISIVIFGARTPDLGNKRFTFIM